MRKYRRLISTPPASVTPLRTARPGRRRGFTLIELLVVIAIAVLLIAMLLPLLGKVRQAARSIVCMSRLRDLAQATIMYRHENRAFPRRAEVPPPTIMSALANIDPISPLDLDTDLLNELRPYLKYPEVTPKAKASELPMAVQCPSLEDVDAGRQSVVPILSTLGSTTLPIDSRTVTRWYTGYAYVVLENDRNDLLRWPDLSILQPTRVASDDGDRRAIIWTDDLHYSSLSGLWRYAHAGSGAVPGHLPLTYRSADAVKGQHRAYTDGGVEFIPPEELEGLSPEVAENNPSTQLFVPLDAGKKRHRHRPQRATLKLGGSYWWF